MRKPKVKSNQTIFRIVAVLILALASAVVVGAQFYFEPGAAISQTNEAAVIKVMAVGRDDSYDTAVQGNLNFHVKVRGSCDDGWKVGSAAVKIKGKVHHLNVNKSLESIGFDNGEKWSFQVATFPYLSPDTQSSPVAMCNAELERRLARGDSKAEVLSKGFDLTAPHGYDAKLSVACLRKKSGFLESYHPSAYTKLPVTISCQPTDFKPDRTPGTPQRTPGTPQRTPGTPQRTPGAPKRTPAPPGRLPDPRPPNSTLPDDKKAPLAQPDLSIRQFLFPPTNDKALRVRVVNTGQGPSAGCRLVLTVRKINGVAVGRTTYVNVPALAAGASDWLLIDAKSILPNNVSLQSTTFRLNVDATELVAESNEANNEVWHNQ